MKKPTAKLNKKRGYILVTVMVFVATVSILCAAVATILSTESQMATSRDNTTRATYAAQAGIDHLCAIMMNNYSTNVTNLTSVMQDENGEKLYYTVNRASSTSGLVISTGCYEKDNVLIDSVTISATIDQHGNIILSKIS